MSEVAFTIEHTIKSGPRHAGEVTQMGAVSPPVNTDEAVKMLRAAMEFLYANATEMVTEEQAQCLQALEQVNSMSTAARARVLGSFISGQGYAADADYSPRSWLIHRTRVTKGAATAHTAWVRRAAAHPLVARRAGRGTRPVGVLRAEAVRLDGQAARGLPGSRGRDPGRRRPGRRGPAGPGRAGHGDLRPLPARQPGRPAGRRLRGPAGPGGDHARRRGRRYRRPDPRVRGGRSPPCWTPCPPRRAPRTPALTASVTTTRCRRR